MPEFGDSQREFDVVVNLAGLSIDDDHRSTGQAHVDLGSATQATALVERIQELQTGGATWTTVDTTPARSIEEYADYIDWFGAEVISKCRKDACVMAPKGSRGQQ